VGEIGNKGVELNLTTVNIERGPIKWSSDFAFSLNRNKVKTILGDDKDKDGKEDDLINAGYFIGKSLGTIYGYKVLGIWQQSDKDVGTILSLKGAVPGSFIVDDVNKDSVITSDKDRQFLGTTEANFRWSFTNTFAYKNWSLLLFVNSVWGGNGYFLSGSNTPYNDPYVNRPDINRPVYDYWTPSNPNAKFPRPDYESAVTQAGLKGLTKYVDRSFIRLQKASVAYNFNDMVSKYGISNMRVAVSADNLFTYAPHWIGMDPETNNGITVSSIPSLRNYSVVLSFNF
jgi:hypothetical protein